MSPMLTRRSFLLWGLLAHVVTAGGAAASEAPLAPYNYAIGTQTIGAAYQFTQEPRLVETARAILELGSTTLKFSLTPQRSERA